MKSKGGKRKQSVGKSAKKDIQKKLSEKEEKTSVRESVQAEEEHKEEVAGDDSPSEVGEKMTKETRGAHLAENLEDNKSNAATEDIKGPNPDEKFTNNEHIPDGYTEGEQLPKKPSEEDSDQGNLGLFDDEDIQPDGSGITNKKIEIVQSTWKLVEELGIENVGVLLFKNIFTIAPGAL